MPSRRLSARSANRHAPSTKTSLFSLLIRPVVIYAYCKHAYDIRIYHDGRVWGGGLWTGPRLISPKRSLCAFREFTRFSIVNIFLSLGLKTIHYRFICCLEILLGKALFITSLSEDRIRLCGKRSFQRFCSSRDLVIRLYLYRITQKRRMISVINLFSDSFTTINIDFFVSQVGNSKTTSRYIYLSSSLRTYSCCSLLLQF